MASKTQIHFQISGDSDLQFSAAAKIRIARYSKIRLSPKRYAPSRKSQRLIRLRVHYTYAI